jgi:hypothetical protein
MRLSHKARNPLSYGARFGKVVNVPSTSEQLQALQRLKLNNEQRAPLRIAPQGRQIDHLGGSAPQTARRPWEFGERPEPHPFDAGFPGPRKGRRGPVSSGNGVRGNYTC